MLWALDEVTVHMEYFGWTERDFKAEGHHQLGSQRTVCRQLVMGGPPLRARPTAHSLP